MNHKICCCTEDNDEDEGKIPLWVALAVVQTYNSRRKVPRSDISIPDLESCLKKATFSAAQNSGMCMYENALYHYNCMQLSKASELKCYIFFVCYLKSFNTHASNWLPRWIRTFTMVHCGTSTAQICFHLHYKDLCVCPFLPLLLYCILMVKRVNCFLFCRYYYKRSS